MTIQYNSVDSKKYDSKWIHIYRNEAGALKAKIYKKKEECLIKPIRFFPFSDVDNYIGLCPIGIDGEIQAPIAIIHNYETLDEGIKKLVDEELNKIQPINRISKIYSIKQALDKWNWDVETEKGRQIFKVRHLGDIRSIKDKIIIKDNKNNIFLINSENELDSKSRNILGTCI